MKIEFELEIKTPPPKNHKWEFVKYGRPKGGDYYCHNDGTVEQTKTGLSYIKFVVKPVRTHHDSGIPIEFPDMDPPEGFTFGEMGWGIACPTFFLFANERCKKFKMGSNGNTKNRNNFYIELKPTPHKCQQPTTLKELVGEEGQKKLWVHKISNFKNGTTLCVSADVRVIKEEGKEDRVSIGVNSLEEANASKLRWSHSPFTSYEDANEFVI